MRSLWLILIIVLTIYAPLELTRVIVINALINHIYDRPEWQFVAEIAMFWALYVIGMVLVYKRIKWNR